MKKLLLFLSICSFSGMNAMAQCNPAIPSNAVVVNFTDTINGGFDPIWVCSGDSLHSDGGFHNIFLEPGAVMTSGGGIDTIWVKQGASLFLNGGIHYIVFDTISDLYSLGGIPTLDSSCTGIVFDYSNAPTNGCFLIPVAQLLASDLSFCAGTCINFTNQSLGATSWLWSFPGANPASSTDENPDTICYNTPGDYDVTLIATNASGSDTITMTNYIHVDSIPDLIISPLSLCAGQSGLITVSGADSITWNPSTNLSTASGDTVTANPDSTITYYVTGLNAGGCSATDSTVVIVNPLPANPVLSQSGDTMYSTTGYQTYQWYNNGTLINGATDYYYAGTQSGDYSVLVTDDKGCEATAIISFVYNAAGDLIFSAGEITVSPNPSTGNFSVQLNSLSENQFEIWITDLNGRKIIYEKGSLKNNRGEVKFDLSNEPCGIYFLHCTTDLIQRNKKIVVVR